MTKRLFLLISLNLVLTLSYSQQKGGLRGRVLDETKQPLPGATISIPSLKMGVSTDFKGNYDLLEIPTGSYKLTISFIGYKTIEEKVTVKQGIAKKNFSLVPKTNKLNEVIVRGSIAKGQAKALSQQKAKINITNIIAADQVGKFPDANIGDALKRIPGISMQNDQGEARDIIIRGLAPQLNSVTLNGDRIPSAEGDNRRVQMDLIPADMIQTIEVNKAVTPDMEGDAIGGSVNLITRTAPSKFRAFLTGSYGTNPIREKSNYNFSALVADRLIDKKLGYVVNASFDSNDYGSDNIEFIWKNTKDDKAYISQHDIRRYDVKRNRKSFSVNLDFTNDAKNSFYFKSLFNQRDDWENRYRLRFRKIKAPDAKGVSLAEVRRQTKGGIGNNTNKNRRLEKQQVYKLSLGADHILFRGIKLKWKVGFSKAQEERPNERYIRFKNQDKVKVFQDFSREDFPVLSPTNDDFNNPSKFKFDEATQERRFTNEKKINARMSLKIPLNATGFYKNWIKLGYRYKHKDKLRDNIFYRYDEQVEKVLGFSTMDKTSVKDYTISDFLPGSRYKSGFFASNEFLGSLDLKDGELDLEEFAPKNYDAKENIQATYLMLHQNFGKKLSFIAGLRLEKTSVDYTGYSIDSETSKTLSDLTKITQSKDYTNWMPNLQAKYKISSNTIFRIAWTNTIARPNYYDLVPYQSINSADQTGSFGNPNLKATQSTNFDFMFEHYFSSVGIVSGGLFYKSIDDFIYKSRTQRNLTIRGKSQEYQITQPLNSGSASVYGLELSLQKKLIFLPDFLRNFTLYANYTYTGSKTDGIRNRKKGLPLSGAVKNMVNTSLAYQGTKLTVRLSLNYADDYIDEYGKNPFEDIYYDDQLFLDTNVSYAINKKLRIFAQAKNLTNQPLRFYQGVKNHTKQAEFYNYTWNIGVKYNF